MPRTFARLAVALLLAGSVEPAGATRQPPAVYDVRSFGAKGDGKTVDSEAINKAVDAAAAGGGGIVELPAGRYLSFSIRLKSHVTLRYVRHARGITMRDIVIATMSPDGRPPMLLQDVRGMLLDHVEAPRSASGPFAALRDVSDLTVRNVSGVADGRHTRTAAGTLPYEAQ